MTDPEVLKTHASLFDRMGQAMGLDLEEEAVKGTLRFEEIAEAVLRCTRCSCSRICDRYMAGLEAEITRTPDYCRNADLLAYLKEENAAAAQ
ncbi:DUF6455 family protein [Phaeobacter sp. B1627]|uniref:DUF6455 family protein n=1 Tax=Phaeobacter sp. B1627 TaxID=2583809 RepID=UPI00111B9041|nr:DUF6455 family protein [Phaeobacter sp. B1627]TNJ48526.1 hypothetical protein FGE21_00835 [Phaeobacter sp. B1627]